MVAGDVSDLMGHLFSGRAADVTLVLGNGEVLAGEVVRVSLSRPRSVTITTPSANQVVVAPGDIIWARARAKDGSVASFGTPEEELLIVLTEWLEHATTEEATRLSTAIRVVRERVVEEKAQPISR